MLLACLQSHVAAETREMGNSMFLVNTNPLCKSTFKHDTSNIHKNYNYFGFVNFAFSLLQAQQVNSSVMFIATAEYVTRIKQCLLLSFHIKKER